MQLFPRQLSTAIHEDPRRVLENCRGLRANEQWQSRENGRDNQTGNSENDIAGQQQMGRSSPCRFSDITDVCYEEDPLMYGVAPRFQTTHDQPALLSGATDTRRKHEMLAATNGRAHRVREHTDRASDGVTKKEIVQCKVGDQFLVVLGSFYGAAKFPAFKSKYKGPYRVIDSKHPRYGLVSSTGKHTRKPIHARQLKKYRERPDYLTV